MIYVQAVSTYVQPMSHTPCLPSHHSLKQPHSIDTKAQKLIPQYHLYTSYKDSETPSTTAPLFLSVIHQKQHSRSTNPPTATNISTMSQANFSTRTMRTVNIQPYKTTVEYKLHNVPSVPASSSKEKTTRVSNKPDTDDQQGDQGFRLLHKPTRPTPCQNSLQTRNRKERRSFGKASIFTWVKYKAVSG
jgi:hypothetical protein